MSGRAPARGAMLSPAAPWRRLAHRLPPREVLITLGLFGALMATVLGLGLGAQATRPYDLNSGGADGLLGLRLWLQTMGYRVTTTDGERFRLPAQADLLFVYPNQHLYTTAEAAELADWVRQGRTLVLVGPHPRDTALRETFGARLRLVSDISPTTPLRQQQPLLSAAPATLGAFGIGWALDLTAAPGAVPVVAAETGQTTLAVRRWGNGTIWHLSPHHDLANAGLAGGQQGAIVLALLRGVPAGGQVVFDTYHLVGPTDSRVGTLYDWAYGTPTGWATLFSALVLAVFLLLQGLRLGRPLPALSEPHRREAAEFVSALAGLHRRARLGGAVAAYHKRRLKIGLGRPWLLSPDLADADFLARLQQADRRLDATAAARLTTLLAGLSGRPDEAALVRLVADVDRVLERS